MKHTLMMMFVMMVAASFSASSAPSSVPLEKIMADPDWMGPPVADGYWSGDGKSVYYWIKRSDSQILDLHRIDLAGSKDQIVDGAAMAAADGSAVYDRAGKRAAFVRNKDVFVRDLSSGKLTQISRNGQTKRGLRFSADGQLLSYRT